MGAVPKRSDSDTRIDALDYYSWYFDADLSYGFAAHRDGRCIPVCG